MPPGSEGLIFFPYLMGERTLGTPYARAVFFGLSPRHNVRQHGAGNHGRCHVGTAPDAGDRGAAGHPVHVISHTGGGAYSDLWSQIKADIYEKPVVTFENAEGGLLGAAILAGAGAGVYANETEGRAALSARIDLYA